MAQKKVTTEELILARLDGIEGELKVLRKSAESAAELRQDLAPLFNSAFRIVMEEMGEVEFGFQLEDLLKLMKRGLRSVRNITYALEQLENVIDLWKATEPMLKSSVPNLINYMDGLERKGVFRTYKAMLEVRAKVAAHYGPEEIAAMGDGFVLFLGFLKKLSNPEMIQFLNQLLDIPLELRLEEVKPLGPLGALSGLGSKEVRQGLSVMLELTKAVGKLKQESVASGQ
jgi:uncharacterized protein YjgD (DUF1641 family)